MASVELVRSHTEAIENVGAYQAAVNENAALAATMAKARAWYAVETSPGIWAFAPSKFVGYAGNDAETYLSQRDSRDGGATEAALRTWFEEAAEDDPLWEPLHSALLAFHVAHGHRRPNARARINVLKSRFRQPAQDRGRAGDEAIRIAVDSAICGGRPHIRGTRVRVSDILGMLAEGVTDREILEDFDYLTAEDIRAALSYGAAATDHLVLETA